MIRRLLVVLNLILCAHAFAQTPPPAARFNVTADLSDLDISTGEMTHRGNAVLRQGNALLTADEIRANDRTGIATATGKVVFTRGTLRLLADKLVYNRNETFSADNVRVGSFPYYAEGASAVGTATEVTINGARLTYGEPGAWQPTLTADRVTYGPGNQLRSENSQVGVGRAQLLPFPKFQQNLTTPFIPFASVNGGVRSSLGVFLDAGVQIPVALGLRVGGDLGLYSKRGVLVGPSATYNRGEHGIGYRGYLRSGYINDQGALGTDLLGRPVPEDRAFVEWQHAQTLAPNLDLKAQLNWWRDSEVVRDFRPSAFFPVQEPDTFLESAYTGKNCFVSLFARFQPNRFHQVQERLPEIRFDLLPLALPGGFYERFHASFARLREDPPVAVPVFPFPLMIATPPLRSDRLDAYYALSRPIAPNDWLTVTPVAGGRVTHYANTRGAVRDGDYTRVLGELGFDAELRASGVFNYKNERWNIDGLRHLFTPQIGYRLIPEGNRGQGRIPRIDDRDPFSTYLPVLGLADARHIDDLRATKTLRLALNNTLQTRDATYGSRDLATFNLAADFRFKRTRAERDVSEIHNEFTLTPADWLQLDVYQSFSPRRLVMREFNSGLVLRDAGVWSVRFSNNFLRYHLHDYAVEGRARINEVFEAMTRLNYDVRKNRFNEQAYGLVQNLGNTWQISYVVSLYSGRRRESSFGFNVQIDALRF